MHASSALSELQHEGQGRVGMRPTSSTTNHKKACYLSYCDITVRTVSTAIQQMVLCLWCMLYD